MDDSILLLDSPKKASLQSHASTLRTALKDFERTFASNNDGRKPGKDDIKADTGIAAKYKEYNKVRDVLAGKLPLEALQPPAKVPRKKHTRADSAISLTPRRPRHSDTPSRKRLLDEYEAPPSASPKVLLTTVAPTPHRDGKILGIFDLLSSAGSCKSSLETPSSRKRKFKALLEDGDSGCPLPAQTPSQRPHKPPADAQRLLPAETPSSRPLTGRRMHHRTPMDSSKKNMLDNFFNTPSVDLFASIFPQEVAPTPVRTTTPLRDLVLGRSAQKSPAADATPPYLKRSFSFKDRLLSVSTSGSRPTSPNGKKSSLGSRTFAPKPLSQLIADREQFSREQAEAKAQEIQVQAELDDLDALREMEAGDVNAFAGHGVDSLRGTVNEQEQPTRLWKKKGQKRTTRRAIIRPTRMKAAPAPKFVAADDSEEEDELEDGNSSSLAEDEERPGAPRNAERVEETQLVAVGPHDEADDFERLLAEAEAGSADGDGGERGDHDDDDDYDELAASDFDDSARRPKANKKHSAGKSKSNGPRGDDGNLKGKRSKASKGKDGGEDKQRMYNPNAQSHMNFRSLKIKNKNSKAKGRGRFGRGRR